MAFDESAVIKAHLAAPPARVYAALTQADALTAWYWPGSMSPRATSEPVVGGRFGIATASADLGFSGDYVELEPPRRIVQTWRWAGDDRSSRVTISLTAEEYRAGWQSCFARLPDYLALTSPRSGRK